MSIAATLLIDDDVGFSTSTKHLFHERGIALDWAQSWDEGLGLFRVGLHELVIADYNLPGSSHGLRLLAKIKPLRPSSKLILISGALTSRAAKIVKETTLVDDYLEKTASLPDTLVELAQKAAGRAQESTDWPAAAGAYLAGSTVYEDDIKRIDAALQGEISQA